MGCETKEFKIENSNFFRAISSRPEAMREIAALYETVMGSGELDIRTKELIYLAVSAVNECGYCSAHHDARARTVGISEHEIEDVRTETDQTFSERDRVALRYARELTRTAATENETKQALENAFRPEQLVELTEVIALANFTNRISNGLGVSVDNQKFRSAS